MDSWNATIVLNKLIWDEQMQTDELHCRELGGLIVARYDSLEVKGCMVRRKKATKDVELLC